MIQVEALILHIALQSAQFSRSTMLEFEMRLHLRDAVGRNVVALVLVNRVPMIPIPSTIASIPPKKPS